jgi:hypothetical protein
MDDRRRISLELCFSYRCDATASPCHDLVHLLALAELNSPALWPDFMQATSPGPLDVVLPLQRRGLRVLAPPAVRVGRRAALRVTHRVSAGRRRPETLGAIDGSQGTNRFQFDDHQPTASAAVHAEGVGVHGPGTRNRYAVSPETIWTPFRHTLSRQRPRDPSWLGSFVPGWVSGARQRPHVPHIGAATASSITWPGTRAHTGVAPITVTAIQTVRTSPFARRARQLPEALVSSRLTGILLNA